MKARNLSVGVAGKRCIVQGLGVRCQLRDPPSEGNVVHHRDCRNEGDHFNGEALNITRTSNIDKSQTHPELFRCNRYAKQAEIWNRNATC